MRVDSQGFLKSASDRSSSVTTVAIGPQFATEGKYVDTKVDLTAIAFVSDKSSFTVEGTDAYVATSRRLMPHHQLSLGRRDYDWSQVETSWNLVGLWSPRFLWDPLRPQRIGLTGFFYTYESKAWRIRAFASPISVPERGYPIAAKNGKLYSASPDNVPPFSRMEMMNQQVDMRYSLQYPPIGDLILRPGAAVSVRYGQDHGFWTQLNYGIMAMHQVDLAVEAQLDATNLVLDTAVHPRVMHHHLVTWEAGYRMKEWSLWASATGESPLQKGAPPSWITNPIGPTGIVAVGGERAFDHGISLSAAILSISEAKPDPKPDDVALTMPGRFPLTNAVQANARYQGESKLRYDFGWKYDLNETSSLFTLDLTFRPMPYVAGGWTFGLGTDVFATSTGKGLFGQYEGNDRIRGRIAYAF